MGTLRIASLSFLLALSAAGAAPSAAQDPPGLTFGAEREGEVVTVTASVEFAVDPHLAWAVLTDYESYPRFISDMRASRILSRGQGVVVVEQKGEFGILFFSRDVETRMAVFENPPRSITARVLSGNFLDFIGRYELVPLAHGVRLDYVGRFIPDFPLPPMIGMTAVRYVLQKRFSELAQEILRRDEAARAVAKSGLRDGAKGGAAPPRVSP